MDRPPPATPPVPRWVRAAQLGLCAWSLAMLAWPAFRGGGVLLVQGLLTAGVLGDHFWRLRRSGHHRLTLGQLHDLARQGRLGPSGVDGLSLLALVLGSVAIAVAR